MVNSAVTKKYEYVFNLFTVSDFTENMPIFAPLFATKLTSHFGGLTLVLLDFYPTARSLVWENGWNSWEMFTSLLRSHNFKSGNISGKIRHCAIQEYWTTQSTNDFGYSVKCKMLWVIFACIPYLTVICLLWKCSSKKLGSYQVPVGCQARKCLDFSQLLYIMF